MAPTVSLRRTGEPMAERPLVGTNGRIVNDRFITCSLDNLLMYKLCGFIEDERAEILNVSEKEVRLLLGRHWLTRLMIGDERRRPLEVRLVFSEPGDDLPVWKSAHARRSVVDVTVRPLSATFGTKEFHRRAASVLQKLRLHFVAD